MAKCRLESHGSGVGGGREFLVDRIDNGGCQKQGVLLFRMGGGALRCGEMQN